MVSKAHADFVPQYAGTVQNWGIGGVFVDKEISLYELRNTNSKLVAKIKWNEKGDVVCRGKCADSGNIFVEFIPSKNYALLAAEDVFDNEDGANGVWAQVYYGGNNKAWLKLDENNKFISWQDFLTIYGKKHGFYLFKDIKKEERKLYARPQDDTRTVDSWESAKLITPWFVKGNWIMVKVLNFDNVQKTGWFKWRTSEGTLRGFVDLRQ